MTGGRQPERCPRCGVAIVAMMTDVGRAVILEEGPGRWALQLELGGAPSLAVRVRRIASHRRHRCRLFL